MTVFQLAEGAGFEPAAHGVGAGFQDRWFQPLTHPSEEKINYCTACRFSGRIYFDVIGPNSNTFCNIAG